MRNNNGESFFSNQQLEREFKRTLLKRKRWDVFQKFVSAVMIGSASLVLLSTFWFPIYHIAGSSMKPTLEQGMIVVGSRISGYSAGDVVAIHFGNRTQISRLIGIPGDSIRIDEQGVVSVNGDMLNEAYLTEPALGATDLVYPYLVPERSFFIMGDNRAESKDSRMSVIGSIHEDALDGKIFFCIWPLKRIGSIR